MYQHVRHIGRGLKIQFRKECRFDSDRPHHWKVDGFRRHTLCLRAAGRRLRREFGLEFRNVGQPDRPPALPERISLAPFSRTRLRSGDLVRAQADSAACVIAQHLGARVIGSAGGADKAAFLRDELRLEEVIDYKAVPNLTKALAAAAPQGIDVFFDNVGGDQLESAIAIANPFARFAICGAISGYNATTPPTAPRNLMLIPSKRLKLEGYIAFDHEDLRPQFLADIRRWHEAGTLVWKETVYEGVERAVDAFLGLFTGANIGKMLVKLG